MISHGARPRRILAAIAVLAAAASFGTWAAPSVAADSPTIRYVATNGDDNYGGTGANDCTDQAHPCASIWQAANYDVEWDTGLQTVVKVAPGTYTQTSSPDNLWICESVEIDGGVDFNHTGAGATIVQGVGDLAAIQIPAGECPGSGGPPTVTLSNLDVTGSGTAPGVMVSQGASVLIEQSTITNGEPGVDVENGASAQIESSTLSGNVDQGAFVSSPESSLTLHQSTVSGTTDGGSWGAESGGVVVESGTAKIDTSTISGNQGRGVATVAGDVHIVDSTIADTSSSSDSPDGGVALVDLGDVPLLRRTAGHAPSSKPGSLKPFTTSKASVTVTGSIVAAQASGVPDCSDLGTDLNDQGYNLSSDDANSCDFSVASHDLIKTDPRLNPLADNGGSTRTMLPGYGSPARDAIPYNHGSCGPNYRAHDQRAEPRPQPAEGACDIGAVESPSPAPPCPPLVILTDHLPDGTVGQPYSQQLEATGGCDSNYHWFIFSGSLPPGLGLSDSGLISGIPTEAGDFPFVVGVNDPAFKALSIHINPLPASTSAPPTSSAPPTTSPAPTTPPPSSHAVQPASTSQTPPSSPPALADTGASVGSQLRLAWLLLAAGIAMLFTGRLRRRAPRRH